MSEPNKALVRRFYTELLNTHDLDRAAEFIAEDFFDHNFYYEGLPQGLEGFRQMFAASFAAFPDLHFTIDELLAEGDKVVSCETMCGTHQGEFMGHAPSGKRFEVRNINILRIKEGQIQERWGIFEELKMLQQLGLAGT